jgi:hypothetical protein
MANLQSHKTHNHTNSQREVRPLKQFFINQPHKLMPKKLQQLSISITRIIFLRNVK